MTHKAIAVGEMTRKYKGLGILLETSKGKIDLYGTFFGFSIYLYNKTIVLGICHHEYSNSDKELS